ncbi:interferon regulatory factor, partial [Elysia marginata]
QQSTAFSSRKASFRCALNSLKDVEQLTKDGAKRGAHARRTFRFLLPSDPKYGRKRASHRQSASSCRGRKKKSEPQTDSASSSPSGSEASTIESASPSPSQSPGQWDQYNLNNTQSYLQPEHVSDSCCPSHNLVNSSDTALKGNWTQDYLEPLEEKITPQAGNDHKSSVTFLTNPDGITCVSTPVNSGANPPTEIKPIIKPNDQALSTRVDVEPNIQSGGVVTGLPNFSELGVSDTCK